MKRLLLLSLLICQLAHAQKSKKELDRHLQPAIFAVTMVMIHDVANPPAASRFYTYCLLGAQEIIARNNKSVVSPSAYVKGLSKIEIESKTAYDYKIAALYCILETGRIILPSGYMLEEDQKKLLATLKKDGYPDQLVAQSVAVAQEVAKKIITFSSSDNYSKLSTRLRYRPLKGDGYWFPTPPGYIEGIEPHWKTIRPMLIDSSGQFKPAPPVPFSKDSASAFYKLTYEVYDAGKKLNEKTRFIASYWDCNPFAINTSGHMSIGFKKISPGGHWMNITSIATTKAKIDLDRGIMIHGIIAATLMDAFISCWDEKYRSNRIRPETVINRYIDPAWQPLLQTPPFPEYTSGHSVVSTAVAEALTYLLGDNFSFTDDTEVIFDLPSRDFKSFRQAAAEAAISRLYGGIHYRDAIENGADQGKRIGEFVIETIKKAGVHGAAAK
ncbi:vanadium-dependent haloperoxidase [Dyadobacter sp. LHD-138]|uniref:vanadium-dependent haloperoxidase n=1 Tax=Dyadobacter sp. LHD-138 TaxID=3071413 RepID=UPI0027E0E50E|nr:vanadium-dependent haloperoxidase [Dyadobacter sp. LHD-138]MDQ6481651.1 vanadium-dependent haloperoxidase [Dyadobacter sp. LHD-138]